MRFFLLSVLIVFGFVCPCAADQTLHIDITGPGQTRMNLFVAPPASISLSESEFAKTELKTAGEILNKEIRHNLSYLPFFALTNGADILGGEKLGGYKRDTIDFKRLRLSRVDLVVTSGWRKSKGLADIELRMYEVFSGKMVVGKAYNAQSEKQLGSVADRFCSAVMKALTGTDDFFKSRIAFVKKVGKYKEIFTVTPQGRELTQISHLNGICLSPSWSADGYKIAFSYLTGTEHLLAVWDSRTGKTVTRNLPGNTCISPVFTPDGSLAVSIDPEGNPDIYQLDDELKIGKALVKKWGIDISPSFEQSGRKMAFVSSRLGNPHVFLLDLKTGQVKRVTYQGKYNTGASISSDGRLLAFARQTDSGHRIFVTDLETGVERQVSFGPGSDEDPSWSPDGYFLVYTSNQSGRYQLYLTSRHGDPAMLIPTGSGSASSPDWGK